jgi:hypothetical protein
LLAFSAAGADKRWEKNDEEKISRRGKGRTKRRKE